MPWALVLSLVLLAPAALPASAQQSPLKTDDVQKEADRPAQQQAAQSQNVSAAGAAAKLEAEDGDVTYKQILADPDNIDLNYRYARKQVRLGELKGASATLERILMLDPNLPSIRMFFAVVLYRMDNLSESEREFKTLEEQNPPADVRAEADKYLKMIGKRKKNTQIEGRLSLGFEYDDNRNASPSSGVMLLQDTPLNLTTGPRDDTSQIYMANVDVHHDLGTQAGHELFGSVSYYRAEQTLVKSMNLAAYSFSAGGTYKSPYVDVTPSLVFDHVELAQTTFLRDYGFDLRLDRKVRRETDLYFELHDVDQDYSPTSVVPDGGDRSGIQVDAVAGGTHLVLPTNRVGASLDYSVKHAAQHFDGFIRAGVTVDDMQLLGRGMFALASFTFDSDHYSDPDALVSQTYRNDQVMRLDLTYGAPLSLLHRSLSDLMWTFSYEWYQDHSTITNYSYTNNKLSTLLTYKWNAGF
jgi:tetratricopeptide (TPR) repeat protein